ncbi:hypothetical protein [Helicobacter sp. T3_23-1056]
MLLDILQSLSANVKEHIAINTKSLQNNIDEQYSLEADNATLDLQRNYDLQAGNIINLQINDTTINATSDKITFKAGGVEVIIDSSGLVVKGGEIKSE